MTNLRSRDKCRSATSFGTGHKSRSGVDGGRLLPLDGEVLEPEPSPRIHRVEVVHRYLQPRQRGTLPPWVIVLVAVAVLLWLFPFATVVVLVMLGILVTAHPAIGIALGATLALVIGIAIHERRHGRPF